MFLTNHHSSGPCDISSVYHKSSLNLELVPKRFPSIPYKPRYYMRHQDIYQWLQHRLNSTRKWWRKLKKLIAWPSTFETCCCSCCCYCGCCCCCLSQTIVSWLNTEHRIRIPFWSIHSIFNHSWHQKKKAVRSRFLARHFNDTVDGSEIRRSPAEDGSWNPVKKKQAFLPSRWCSKAGISSIQQ